MKKEIRSKIEIIFKKLDEISQQVDRSDIFPKAKREMLEDVRVLTEEVKDRIKEVTGYPERNQKEDSFITMNER